MIEEIYYWKILCTPWNKGPIRAMTIEVVAKDRKEAELIVLDKAHKFFEQDMFYDWTGPIVGFRNIIDG